MGNQDSSYVFTQDLPEKNKGEKITYEDYKQSYNKLKNDTQYLFKLLHENSTIPQRIIQFFPTASASYQDFLQMVFYMKSYDHWMQHNQYAKYNAHNTSLLDRFFMLIIKARKYEELQRFMVNQNSMEDLFLQLMKLLMPNPQKGFITKLLQFIQLKDIQKISLKQYSLSLKQHLPQIQKYIDDYFTQKFKLMIENGYLLRYFPSQILYQDAVLLSMVLGYLTKPSIKLLFEPSIDGSSFTALKNKIIGYTGPWLLIIEHLQKDLINNQRTVYRLGAFQNGPILDIGGFQGDISGFLFTIQPKIKLIQPFNQNGKNFFFLNNIQDKLGRSRQGLGFGGNDNKQNFKLWIDEDIEKSTVYNGHDETYGFGSLVSPGTTQLMITKLQIFGLGSEQDFINQENYWNTRKIQIQKRRKVNKQDLFQGAGIIFEKTFVHRDHGEVVIRQKKLSKNTDEPHQQKPSLKIIKVEQNRISSPLHFHSSKQIGSDSVERYKRKVGSSKNIQRAGSIGLGTNFPKSQIQSGKTNSGTQSTHSPTYHDKQDNEQVQIKHCHIQAHQNQKNSQKSQHVQQYIQHSNSIKNISCSDQNHPQQKGQFSIQSSCISQNSVNSFENCEKLSSNQGTSTQQGIVYFQNNGQSLQAPQAFSQYQRSHSQGYIQH